MKPVIYQVLPRYWGPYKSQNVRNASLAENGCGHFADFDTESLDYIKGLGCSHIWYTGVIRHATACNTAGCTPSHPSFVKGQAGSPYAITDYYDVNPYLAENPDRRMEEFEDLVRRSHEAGLKVIIDFVPNHVSRDNKNFGMEDDRSIHWKAENDFYYYPGEHLRLPVEFIPTAEFPQPYEEYPARATGNNCFNSHPSITDWYETVKLNYCDFHTPTWDKMLEILSFWAEKGVDGFRCDMVELVPGEFFEWLIARMKEKFPGIIFIAEVYKKDLYRHYIQNVGFDYLYDKSGLYDTLREITSFNVYQGQCHPQSWQSTRRITHGWQRIDSIQEHLLNFLENHDEQRIASDFFLSNAEKALAGMALAFLFNRAAVMIYSGQEIGEKGMDNEGFSSCDGRTTIFDWWKPQYSQMLWDHIHGKELPEREQTLLNHYREILGLASSDTMKTGCNYDLCFCNEHSRGFIPDRHFAFLRYDEKNCYLVVCNFGPDDANMDINMHERSQTVSVDVKAFSYIIKEI